MPDADGMRCEPIRDDDGTILGIARISGQLSERDQKALRELIAAAPRRAERAPRWSGMSRPLLMPAAAVLAAFALLGVTATFAVAGWKQLAAMTALAGLPVGVVALASCGWVWVLGWKALGDARRQLADLEAERSGGVPVDERDQR